MAFAKCFKSNMEALGLPAPQSLFGNAALATATIAAIAKAVKTYGTKVTVREIVGAGIVGESGSAIAAGIAEVAEAVAGVIAAFYLGACIGSLIACTVDKIFFPDVRTSPIPVAQLNVFLDRYDIDHPDSDLVELMRNNPEMLGVTPSDDYQNRLNYYAFASTGGSGDSASA